MSIDLHLDLHPAPGVAGVAGAAAPGGGRLAAPAGMPGDIVRVGAASPLVRVAREAFRLGDVDFLCFGESDHAAPEGAIAALKLALDRGETRYPDIRGLPPLRAALAAYLTGLHQRPVSESRVAVTASGMAALTVAFSALLRAGDRVVVVSPSWPNPTSLARTRGATVHEFALGYDDDGFRLDLDALEATLAGARLLFLNSPNNPTGWCASDAELAAILAMCRRHGVWIVSDDVYSRLVFDGREAAPSILDHAGPEDRVIVCNSFSKAWAMTGFRVGWLVVPEGLRDEIGELIEITHSGVAPFTQRAAIAALADEAFVRHFRDYCARGRAVVDAAFAGLPGVRYRPPVAAFYAFAQIEGLADSGEFAMRLVREQRIAVAPGGAFGPGGEGFIRICFAQDSARLAPAMARFTQSLASLEPSY